MTAVAPIPPISWLANDAVTLLDAIVAKHGGAEALGTAGMEIALSLVRLHGDVRATTDGMTRVRLLEGVARLSALLPAPAAAAAVSAEGEVFDSDAAIAVFVVGELSDDDLSTLAAGLRAFSPSNECLAGLVDENTGLRRQLFDCQMAFGRRDFEQLNLVLAAVSGPDGRVDLVERMQRDLDALRAEVEGLRGERVGAVYGRRAPGAAQGEREASPAGSDAPKPGNAPAPAPGHPGGRPLRPDEAAGCQPLLGPGQSYLDAAGPVVMSPSGAERFSWGGSGA